METNPVSPSYNVALLTELKIDPMCSMHMKTATVKYTYHCVLEFGVIRHCCDDFYSSCTHHNAGVISVLPCTCPTLTIKVQH